MDCLRQASYRSLGTFQRAGLEDDAILEIAHDAFLAAWGRRHSYDPSFGSLEHWVAGYMWNMYKRARTESSTTYDRHESLNGHEIVTLLPGRSEDDPAIVIARSEFDELVRDIIRMRGDETLTPLEMTVIQADLDPTGSHSTQGLATTLRIREVAVRKARSRAHRKLKAALTKIQRDRDGMQ